jgi:hypothetical protein
MATEHGGFIEDGRQVASTLCCPHCGAHFVSIRGSGKRRAWCTRCMAVTCGLHACDECIPIEARLDHSEGRKTLYDEKINQLLAEGAALL